MNKKDQQDSVINEGLKELRKEVTKLALLLTLKKAENKLPVLKKMIDDLYNYKQSASNRIDRFLGHNKERVPVACPIPKILQNIFAAFSAGYLVLYLFEKLRNK